MPIIKTAGALSSILHPSSQPHTVIIPITGSTRAPSLAACLTCTGSRATYWHLLSLLKFQFNWRLDAVAGVLIGLFKCQLHQVLVVRPRHVATQENDDIGQNLYGKTKNRRNKKKLVKSNIIICFHLILKTFVHLRSQNNSLFWSFQCVF